MFVCAAQSHCFNVLASAVGVLEAQLKKNLSTPHQLFMGGLGRDLCWLYVLVLSEFMHNTVSPCVRVQYFQLLL